MPRYDNDEDRKAARALTRYKERLKRRYSLTLADFEQLLESQDFACAICKTKDPNGSWCIDHDHSCCPPFRGSNKRSCGNCVRGLLCQPCNKGLGCFKDNTQSLLNAVSYLGK